MDNSIEDRLAEALTWIPELTELALSHFGRSRATGTKGDGSVVTEADLEIERWLRDRICAAFPGDGVVGEELGVRAGSSDCVWTVDPIDGTDSFARGVPLFGTMLGLATPTLLPHAGIIHMPALGETVYAARGVGTFWRTRPERSFERCTVDESTKLLCYSDARYFDIHGVRPLLTELEKRSGALRTWGDCYGHVLVATGRAQAMVDPYMYAWDIVPIQAVVEEAGGICPGWRSPRDDRFFAGISATPKTYMELEHLVETHLRR